jgi:hypothetical protein
MNDPQIEQLDLETLIPYARNSRTHSETQVAQIAASIREFGFTNPVLIDGQGTIIAGHGRVMAARKLALATVPCIRLEHLSDTQKRAYIIADNAIALNSGWDNDLLKLELTDLGETDFDMTLLGFTQGELANLFLEVEKGETDPNKEWDGMPEFDQPDKNAFRSVIVHFECQSDVDEFTRLIGQKLTDKTKSIWHPEQVRMDTESKRY